jgi:ribonuclease R
MKSLLRNLHIPKHKENAFREALEELKQSGKLSKSKEGLWSASSSSGVVTGVIQFNSRGFAFLVPEDKSEDIFIPAGQAGMALHQDVVQVRAQPDYRREGKRIGSVLRVIKRRREHIVGTLRKSGGKFIVQPEDPRLLHPVYVNKPETGFAEMGDLVVARLKEWKAGQDTLHGKIVERLGSPGDPGVDLLAILHKHELRTEFPEKVLAEVARFATNAEGHAPFEDKRTDLRKEFVITIDPDTAKDFDDAISLKQLDGGETEVGIHIADVSHYVKPDSQLDAEAHRRGNSTYLVHQVIPMLPEELSNGLCSLLPHVDRLTHSVFVTLDERGFAKKSRIEKSVICSRHRLTYQQAYELLQKPPQDELGHFLHNTWTVASKLRTNRFKNGALDLDFPEIKIYVDAAGRPLRMEKMENDISHQLIEELMLLANQVVATTLNQRNIPALYRIHENPDPEKLNELRVQLSARGIKTGDLSVRQEMQRAVKTLNSSSEFYGLKLALLKSLKRAVYSSKSLGHYGLAMQHYTHFTSPIRRYADLIVHRSCEALNNPAKSSALNEFTKLAEHLSQTERTSAEAEQDTVRLKTIEYLSAQAAHTTSFKAYITEITPKGCFVDLPEYSLSGFVALGDRGDDDYKPNAALQCITRRRGGKTLRQGDVVNVTVEKVDLKLFRVDFRFAQI